MRSLGYINAQGKYVLGEDKKLGWDVNPTYKRFDHDRQRKEFAKEIIQPHKGSQPNPAFVKAYPEESKEYFSQTEIDKAMREL